jgi:dsDNA-specific endonuclease/ATPase MutS2
VQRAVVRKVLAGMPEVAWFEDAPALSGGWGATVVALRGEENNES